MLCLGVYLYLQSFLSWDIHSEIMQRTYWLLHTQQSLLQPLYGMGGLFNPTQVPEDFCKVVKRTSGNGSSESHFHAVDSCQICHLNNSTISQSLMCYNDSSNQERGSDSDPT